MSLSSRARKATVGDARDAAADIQKPWIVLGFNLQHRSYGFWCRARRDVEDSVLIDSLESIHA